MDLDKHTLSKITQLCAQGDEEAKSAAHSAALGFYQSALDLLPQPKTQWEASTWIQTAIADSLFSLAEFEAASAHLEEALKSPGGIGNAFIHLRLGQCLAELGDSDRAIDQLTRAFMSGGEEVFDGEDPKYMALLRTVLRDFGEWTSS